MRRILREGYQSPQVINAMSVDVEDYFQVSAFSSVINRKQWDSLPCRVEKNISRILELFSESNVKATFFTLGWIADRYPMAIKEIFDAGHEIASHGYAHERIVHQNPRQFFDDVSRSKKILEDLTGQSVLGYRAPSYSIVSDTLWAHDVLAEVGYQYSSSVVPVSHDLYGIPGGHRFPYLVAGGKLLEIPISTIGLAGKNINCGGGGWFRLFPYSFTRWAISSINVAERKPCVFYFHPWEIDPLQPRVKGASVRSRFRHYLNLSKTTMRLSKLLTDFRWDSMQEVYLSNSDVRPADGSHEEVNYVAQH